MINLSSNVEILIPIIIMFLILIPWDTSRLERGGKPGQKSFSSRSGGTNRSR